MFFTAIVPLGHDEGCQRPLMAEIVGKGIIG